MENTSEKIQNGTIRIEGNRIVGLGIGGHISISLDAIDELFGTYHPQDLAKSIYEVITRIGSISLELHMAAVDSETLRGNIITHIPCAENLWELNDVSKIFNS